MKMKSFLAMKGLTMAAGGLWAVEPDAYGPRALGTKKGKINAKIRAKRKKS